MCTRRILFALAVVLALLTLGGRARAYTNQWAAHVDGGEAVARRVAEDYGFRYLGKVSAKACEATRALKRSEIPSDEFEATRVKLVPRCPSRVDRIHEPDVFLSAALLPSHEKFRAMRAFNERPKIPPRRLLTASRGDVSEFLAISRRNFSTGERDPIANGRILARRNDLLDAGIIARLEQSKRRSTRQSSREEDGCSGKSRERIEDRRQSADSCRDDRTFDDGDVHRTPESCQSSSDYLQNTHREYYRSIESACPIHLNKPAPYNDRRTCGRATACRPSSEADERDDRCATRRGRVTSGQCSSGKPATDSEIHRECESRPCAPAETRHDSEEPDSAVCRAPPRTYPATYAATYELQMRPDPPPLSSRHWTENPPPYCDRCPARERTCAAKLVPEPMIFVPVKGPRKFRDAASSLRDVCGDSGRECGNECGRTDVKTTTRIDADETPRLRESSPGKSVECSAISLEGKRVDFSRASASATQTKHRWFLMFARSNRRLEKPEKKFATREANGHSKLDATSDLKYRSDESPCVKEMRNTVARESLVVQDEDAWRRRETSARGRKSAKRLESRRQIGKKKERRMNSGSGWSRQRYKVRLKVFRKPDGRLDPCLPPIAELRQPRGAKTRPSKSESTTKARAAFSWLQNPCTAKQPITETKSYPTKMEECSRMINDDWYHMEHRSVAKRSTEPHLEVHQRLMRDSRIRRAEQQRAKSRTKRDLIIKHPSNILTMLNDERWLQMWYLNRGKGLDMNVQAAWAEGITGSGVVVTILDDGLEKDHPDLYKNYDPQASYDVNSHDEDPMPRYDLVDSNRHGTRCAGEVAATANNSICAVGVAFGAGVGGVRMLDGDVTDAVEARSLSLNPQHIDIYSASWGPDDDGKTVDGPGELATRAFIEGITKGRNGKGSIFVWASGNGGRDHDNCNCDGYTNSIWTLSISSATENGLVPWYSEACSSTLATTYSSGATGERQVVTTDLHHHCTSSHTGTSASAPLAAGICALALEANRDLTWRDMQHIVVRTAKPANLQAPDWVVNGVGRNVSHSFGYGLMDATAMVHLARRWRTVPEQHKCEVSAPHTGRSIPPKSQLVLELHVKECSGVNFLEHVQAKVSLMASRRGDLQIQLTSPQGTRSTLLAKRPHDVSKAGFSQWPFMSVHTWGERPHGTWKLEIHNEGRYFGRATLHEWALIFYGTATLPDRTEYALYNPAGMSVQRRPFVKPRETSYSKSQNALTKGKQTQHKSDKTGSLSPSYVVNAQIQSQRKGKSRGQHKNGKSANRPNPKPTVQTLRGLTAVKGPAIGDMRSVTSRPRGRSTPSPITTTSTTTQQPIPSTRRSQIAMTSRHRIVDLVTASPLQRGLILMEPPAKAATNKVPAVFRQYPKIQQLYPVYGGARGVSQQHATRAKGLDLLQDEQFDPRNLQLDKDNTVEEWRLVFYGTETSVELDDELDRDKPLPPPVHQEAIQNNAAPDTRQNAVDTEGDPWTGSQQVNRVSHPEVQRPTTENQTSGCATFEPGGGGSCLVCKPDWYHVNGSGCVQQCPFGTYAWDGNGDALCAACHYTCRSCTGPGDADCVACHADTALVWNDGRAYCVPSDLAWRMRSTLWFYRMSVLFLVNMAVMTAVVAYLAIAWYIRRRRSVHKYSKVSYSNGNGEVHADAEQLQGSVCVSDSE